MYFEQMNFFYTHYFQWIILEDHISLTRAAHSTGQDPQASQTTEDQGTKGHLEGHHRKRRQLGRREERVTVVGSEPQEGS